jgi:type VI secretion system secreted protein VgrG
LDSRELRLTLNIDGQDPEALRVISFAASERIDDTYTVFVDLSTYEALEADHLLGKTATFEVSFGEEDVDVHRWHGIVAEATVDEVEPGSLSVQVVIAPPMAALRLGRQTRMFQKLSVPDLVKQVLIEGGIAAEAQSWLVSGNYQTRDYVVQYQESDYELVTRLLAEEGIAHVHTNDDAAVKVVFFDDSTGLPLIPGTALLSDRRVAHTINTVSDVTEELASGLDAVVARDYLFQSPATDLAARAAIEPQLGHEAYLHPGRFQDPAGARRAVDWELTSELARTVRVRGSSDCPRLEAGRLFSMEGSLRPALSGDFLLISVEHRAHADHGEGSAAGVYVNEWVALPKPVFYRPAVPIGPNRPEGPEPAFVTCPSGEEIHTDDFGRVKVRFPWDRSGVTDDKSSTWLRVGQLALGGAMVHPRKDFEVMIDFELGRVDRPCVAGHLYNGEKPPPYGLPAHKVRGAMQSATTPGGGSSNEFRVDDTNGSEEIMFNASQDMAVAIDDASTTKIGNNEKVTVGVNHTVNVGGTHHAQVVGARTVKVGSNQKVNVGADFSTKIGGNSTTTIGAARKVQVGGDLGENTKGALTRTVGALQSVTGIAGYERKVVGASTVTVGAAWTEVVAGGRSSTVGGSRAETVGALKMVKANQSELSCKENHVVTAASETVECTGSRTDQTKDDLKVKSGGGLKVKAKNITVEAKEKLTVTAGSCEIKLESSGKVSIKGSSVDLLGVKALTQAQHKSN